jgi:hypothetical protein
MGTRPGADRGVGGARLPAQLEPIADVSGWRLGETTVGEIDRILAATVANPVAPEFMAPPPHLAT